MFHYILIVVVCSMVEAGKQTMVGVCNNYKSEISVWSISGSNTCHVKANGGICSGGLAKHGIDPEIPNVVNAKDFNSRHMRVYSNDSRVALNIWRDDNQGKIYAGPAYGRDFFQIGKEFPDATWNLAVTETGDLELFGSDDPNDCPTVCKVTDPQKIHGSWKYKYVIASIGSESWEHGTTQTHKESKSKEWSKSVTTTVKSGFEFEGYSTSISVSKNIGQKVSEMYSDEWSISDTHIFTVTWTKDDIGKVAWQWHMSETDNCGHKEDTLVKDFALTSDAATLPCCVPGYGADMPFYTKCISKAAMIPGGEKKGCKVK